jgi:HTH-type transcriptional repressor of NAD biosynthesis genes
MSAKGNTGANDQDGFSLGASEQIGVVMGRFCPPHRGHDYLIETAAAGCDELFVLVVGNSRDEAYLPLALRAHWLSERFESPRVHVIIIVSDLPNSGGDPVIVTAWCELIRRAVGWKPIARFFTSEAHTYGDWTATALGATHICVDPERAHVPISATAIRMDPLAAAQFLDPPVLAYFVERTARGQEEPKAPLTEGSARP